MTADRFLALTIFAPRRLKFLLTPSTCSAPISNGCFSKAMATRERALAFRASQAAINSTCARIVGTYRRIVIICRTGVAPMVFYSKRARASLGAVGREGEKPREAQRDT